MSKGKTKNKAKNKEKGRKSKRRSARDGERRGDRYRLINLMDTAIDRSQQHLPTDEITDEDRAKALERLAMGIDNSVSLLAVLKSNTKDQ